MTPIVPMNPVVPFLITYAELYCPGNNEAC